MKYIYLLFLLSLVSACQIGDFPQERINMYENNQTNCQQEPQKCINGYPW